MAPYRIIKQGYMLKEPPYSKRGMRKKLKRYWFVLLEDKKQVAFVYYKNEESYIARQRNVGFIRIDNSRINVIGDYLSYKNAFEIITEKSEYTFVSETRYELHDWIFVLHNTLESFHRRMERIKVRMEERQRALSGSSVASDNPSSHASPTPGQQAGATPPTPKRRTAPTPPNASPKTGTSSRRRPRRPAPVAPQQTRGPPQSLETSYTHNHTHPEFPRQYSHEGPISQAMGYGADDTSDQQHYYHTVLDLEITQVEEAAIREDLELETEPEREGERLTEREEAPRYVIAPVHINPDQLAQANSLRPAPVHQRSVSDTSVLLCRTNSSSLPELVEGPGSTSPEPVSDTVEGAKEQIIRQEALPVKKFRTRHTRHLSLLGSNEHKRKKRRSQLRTRSPPNYPPPPPPANEDSEGEPETEPERKNSLGFSRVMQTISSIDQELQDMGGVAGANTTPNVSPPMRFRGDDPPNLEGDEKEPEQLAAAVAADMEEARASLQFDNSPIPAGDESLGECIPAEDNQLQSPLSPTKRLPPPVAAKPKPKPKPKKNKVMFKEEVEDIPSYEPRIDDEESPPTGEESEEIPSSVAALKEMLFGQSETQKYSKEGPMSLRFGAFVDTEDYDEDLHAMLTPTSQQHPRLNFSPEPQAPSDPHYQHLAGFTALSDGAVGESDEQTTSQPGENEYDTPWENKPISKFFVVGYRKQTSNPAQRTQSFEVVSHTTELPGNTERRNVSSLERQLKSERHDFSHAATASQPTHSEFDSTSPQTLDSDLLQSISSTLQTRSKYGSDSLLTSFSQGDVPANFYQQQGRMSMQQIKSGGRSARGDLEKIRTQHKRSITLPTAYSGPQLQQKSLSHSHQSVSRGGSVGEGKRGREGASYHGRPARKAQSVDRLQVDPATLVTYNTFTKSHTLQSLV